MSGKNTRRLLLVALLVIFPLFLVTACESEEDRRLIREFVEEWARSKNVHPTNEDGSINIGGALNALSGAVTGSTGDKEADAAIGAFQAIQSIQEADSLMNKGRKDRDPVPMDQALQKRPHDWTYHLSRASLELEKGNLEAYQQYRRSSLDNRGASESARKRWNDQTIREIKDVDRNLGGKFASGQQCKAIYGELQTLYTMRYNETKAPEDSIQASKYGLQASYCAQ